MHATTRLATTVPLANSVIARWRRGLGHAPRGFILLGHRRRLGASGQRSSLGGIVFHEPVVGLALGVVLPAEVLPERLEVAASDAPDREHVGVVRATDTVD